MADDEQLREALLELQFLRQREAQTLEQTRNLVACLEAYSTAPSPDAALTSLLSEAKLSLRADLVCLVARQDEEDICVLAATDSALHDATVHPPVNLFRHARSLTRASALGDWQDALNISPDAALLICPVPRQSEVLTALLALRRPAQSDEGERTTAFSKADLALMKRLAPLSAQAMRNVRITREKDLLSAAIAGSSTGIAIADARDPEMPLVYVNKAFEKISGYSAEEALGQNCRFLSAEAQDAPERARLRKAVEECSEGTFLLRNKRKSGRLFWNELSLFPVYDADGQVQHLVATQSDVTTRIEANKARDQTRAQMSMALSASEDAFLILEKDGVIAVSNHAVRELFPAPVMNWQVGTLFSENWSEYLSCTHDLPGRVTSLLRAADLRALSRVPVGQELDLPDGRTVFLRCAALEDGGLVVTATDISPMKSAQNLLAQRLAAIEAAPDGIAVTDPDGRLTYLNSAAARLMGFKQAISGLGRIWWHQYQNRIALENIKAFEPTLAMLENAENHAHEVTSSPLENGGHVILVRDVTEKLAQEAREEKLTQQMIQMQRQEALSQVTAGVAHDFNNYLAAINGSATLLELADDLPENLRAHVQRISAAGAQSARLVNRLLDMGSETEETRRFDLNSALNDLPDLVRPLLPHHITFDLVRSPEALVLQGDPSALNDVLLNVILNARDAIGNEAGQIQLKTSIQSGPSNKTGSTGSCASLRSGTLKPGRLYAAMKIKDTGGGMDDATQERMFDAYFSTKGARGTGLGMAMVAGQLKAVGGAIGVTSVLGKGTQICLFWPLVEDRIDAEGVPLSPETDLQGRVVVIVDDDPQVGEVMARYLEAHGAEVALVEDAHDALEAIEDDPLAWSALITDYDMPNMSGGALVHRVTQVAPQLPVLVVTALARRLNDPRLDVKQVVDILPKPVDLARLSALLAKAAPPLEEG